MMQKIKSVNDYFSKVPKEHKNALQKLRKTIRAADPKATECIGYGMPMYKHNGHPLVAYMSAKDHCSFFPMGSRLIRMHSKQLKSYSTAKGTIRFQPSKPLPATLVKKMVKTRVAEIEKRWGKLSKKS